MLLGFPRDLREACVGVEDYWVNREDRPLSCPEILGEVVSPWASFLGRLGSFMEISKA